MPGPNMRYATIGEALVVPGNGPIVTRSPPFTPVGLRRREEILRIATRLFATRGFTATRMDDLAAAAGLNKATVYHYYPGKVALLYDIYRRAAVVTIAAVQCPPDIAPVPALALCTRKLMEVVATDPHGAAVYFQESPFIDEWFTAEQALEIRRAEATVYERIRELIDRGVASGEFRDCDSHLMALGYIGMTLGSHRWLSPDSPADAERIADEIGRALLNGLSRPDFAPRVQNIETE